MDIDRIQHEIWWSTSRSSGKGGQHVNTTESQVELHWSFASSSALSETERQRLRPVLARYLTKSGELIIKRSSHRSQHRNKAAAWSYLEQLLITGIKPPKKRKATKPTRASIRKRLDSKKKQADKKRTRGKIDY
ncbi:MAG: aminoacyl-tRNA hydrolase [Bdellovibrionaceae bacterium]|nr:aminoacyl-tRNA hydrolase [Pseudobdellovibrionaceae bacterium]